MQNIKIIYLVTKYYIRCKNIIIFILVSGVILANASLDIAFHDTVLFELFNVNAKRTKGYCFFIAITLMCYNLANSFSSNINKGFNSSSKLDYYNDYIKIFWVGLMDGDGSIQVNHWRKKSLQYRLIIKLSNLKSNYNMLVEIAKIIGGTVRITGKNKDVIWVVNNKQEILNVIKIYDTYPPLTSKKICQLAFLKRCLSETSVETYLFNRKLKYDKQLMIIESNANISVNAVPSYFKAWLSGFIEAEGCFSIRNNNTLSFSIGQNDDIYLINVIKEYFQIGNKVRNPYSKFFSIEAYKKEVLLGIIIHFNNYPLLGEKLESLNKFKQKLV